jgi:diguanylate cyclase (GGDEF)-like protein
VSAEGAPLRIILIGRTGLDAKLRLDEGVELVRVRTPLEAVGELADPMEPELAARTVVIVAPDADPARRADGAGHNTEDGWLATEFLSALRHVDPRVRVLRLEAGDGSAPARAGYDGVINADASAGVLRAVVRGLRMQPVEPAQAETPETETPEPEARASEPPAALEPEAAPAPGASAGVMDALVEAAAGPAEMGDGALVRLLLTGADITDAAVELLRRRLGTDLVFVTAGPAAEGMAEASVAWRGRLLGRLRSRGMTAEGLASHAAWLGSWLAMRDQHAQLRDAAFSDPLTGAHNRRFFDHFLGVALEQAGRERRSVTMLMFDIDNFKVFNDTYGHGAGDEILVETVRLLRSVIRPSDKVCRMGGDEFVVIFHEPTGPRDPASKPPSSVAAVARRFQDAIAAHKFPKLGRDAPATLTISGGLATFPWDGRTAAELLARADELALQSKRTGKNCITLGPGAERECGSGAEPG